MVWPVSSEGHSEQACMGHAAPLMSYRNSHNRQMHFSLDPPGTLWNPGTQCVLHSMPQVDAHIVAEGERDDMRCSPHLSCGHSGFLPSRQYSPQVTSMMTAVSSLGYSLEPLLPHLREWPPGEAAMADPVLRVTRESCDMTKA